ncbi:MAG: GAF domain-containing protein [Phaeospirillum sp.]|nr:GAF domain-containing protein [Phaeospirillum sp.]
MSQVSLSRSYGAANPPAKLPMDKVVAWLGDPAYRLSRMLRDMPDFSALRHVSLSVHETATDMLWAFACSDPQGGAPEVHEIEMVNAPSLSLMVGTVESRIIDNLAEFGASSHYQATGSRSSECRSCMTVPIHQDGEFLGFVIFGAAVPGFFVPPARDVLETYAEAFAILISRAIDEVTA